MTLVVSESILAPAKVNLCLDIVGRRSDGYHLLDSLMVPISLYDRLLIRLDRNESSEGAIIRVDSDSADVPSDSANIAHRAAALFLATIPRSVGVDIHIRKCIPVGSGLGGGSSDAAAVLVTLNRMFGCPLEPEDLITLAAQVGADVAFFVSGGPARVRGIGDQVQRVKLPKRLFLVLCTDGYLLSTRLAYSRLDPSLTIQPADSSITNFVSGRVPISDLLRNDLEVAAAQIHPEMLTLKARLMEQGASHALMTGSGSAVFGVCSNPEIARNAAKGLRRKGLWARAVHTLDASPVVVS